MELFLVVNWNACSKCKTAEGKEFYKPFRYLALKHDAFEDLFPIKAVKELDISILKKLSKMYIIGDRENPKLNKHARALEESEKRG